MTLSSPDCRLFSISLFSVKDMNLKLNFISGARPAGNFCVKTRTNVYINDNENFLLIT
jgi:hypothetical protein